MTERSSDEFVAIMEEKLVSKRQRKENRNKGPISLYVRIIKMLRRVSVIIAEEILYPCTDITFKIDLGF